MKTQVIQWISSLLPAGLHQLLAGDSRRTAPESTPDRAGYRDHPAEYRSAKMQGGRVAP